MTSVQQGSVAAGASGFWHRPQRKDTGRLRASRPNAGCGGRGGSGVESSRQAAGIVPTRAHHKDLKVAAGLLTICEHIDAQVMWKQGRGNAVPLSLRVDAP